MPEVSAGILLYRHAAGGIEVLLVHPGGPFWARKDDGAWSIPKGLIDPGEQPESAARREFAEETGVELLAGPLLPLGSLRQPSGKTVIGFAFEGEFEPGSLSSNSFEMEWPPRSGRRRSFPEIDRADWFGVDEARQKLLKGQLPFLDALERETRGA
jgi:predicted NUDIX family NTP pyrophosphohydrolase